MSENLTPSPSDRARELLRAAGALERESRLSFLREQCGSDDALRAEVRDLLEQQDGAPTVSMVDGGWGASSAAGSEFPLPRQISHYRIVGEVGHGGMGIVYRAVDVRLNRTVAIKVLPPGRRIEPARRERIIREAQTASSLNHPNVVTIHEIEQLDDAVYVVMEYVNGQTLADRMRQGALAFQETLRLAVQVADAVAAAHAAGIVHRDLKPANIMVTETGSVKLLDFGVAKLFEAAGSAGSAALALTAEGVVVGTPLYMSPEQAEGRTVDSRSDVFAFGVVLFEMLTGQHPFAADSITGILKAITQREAAPPSRFAAGLPAEIDAVVTRCLRKNPDERPQHMSEVQSALRSLIVEPWQNARAVAPPTRALTIRKRAFALLLTAVAVGLGWWWSTHSRSRPAGPSILVRLTSDRGLTSFPAVSPDGKLICYSSDRNTGENLDLWVQQVGGGDPVRISSHEADETEPSFSPDGLNVAFRSEQSGGGVYVVPALGGESQLVAPGGRNPRFSPDGHWILYWTGEVGGNLSLGSARMFMVPATGGKTFQLRREFAAGAHPLWLPDGKRVLFLGRPDASRPAPEGVDWWIASTGEGKAVSTGAINLLGAKDLSPPAGERFHVPEAVTADGKHILFSARRGDATNLWQVEISRDGKIIGEPIRLSSGTGVDRYPAPGPDGIVFSSQTVEVNVWSLALGPSGSANTGELEQITTRVPFEGYPSISTAADRMVFVSARTGNWDVWLRELDSGKERPLTRTPARELQPKISGDGTRAAWFQQDGDQGSIYVVETRSGAVPEKVCAPCGAPTHLSTDGRALLFETFSSLPLALFLLDLHTRKQVALIEAVQPRDNTPYAGRFSPDGRWVAFHRTRRGAGSRRIFVAPLRNGSTVQEHEWIPITDEGRHLEPYWSSDARLLYFMSDRDGFRCIWAQPLDKTSKHPNGAAFAVAHFHNAVRSITGVGGSAGAIGLSATRHRLIFALGDVKGNLWHLTTHGAK